MIRYALRCRKGHDFDGWFAGSDAFDAQASAGQVACPDCGTTDVEKALMAPSIPRRQASAPAPGRAFYNAVRAYRTKVMAETDDVGADFPRQARAMHEGTEEHRPIRGAATPDEAKAMREDGVAILPVPPEPPTEN